MLSSSDLKKIRDEARPYIRRQMEDAKVIASFREVVAAGGGDWSALKAVIKAEIQDEDDDAGDRKKIGKIVGKAEWTRIYADMLGLGGSNMNEKNSFAGLEGIGDLDPHLVLMLIQGSQTEAGLSIIRAALEAVQDGETEFSPSTGEVVEKSHHDEPQAAMPAQTVPAAMLEEGAPELASVESSATVLKQEPSAEAGRDGGAGELGGEEGSQSPLPSDRVENTSDGPTVIAAAPHSEPVPAADLPAVAVADARSAVTPPAAAAGVSNITEFKPARRQWRHSDKAHPDCLDPGMCGGLSNLARCQRCKDAAASGQVA